MFGVHVNRRASRRQRQTSSNRAKWPCVCQSTGWDFGIRYANGGASMQAHRRLVLLVGLLAMAPLNPDESVRHDGGALLSNRPPMRPLLEYDSPHRMLLSLALCQHAKSSCRFSRQDAVPAGAADTCSSSPVDAPTSSGTALHARRLGPELSLRPRFRWTFPLSARHLHANSLPASLCFAHRYHHERNAMPGHCMRAEKHLRRALHPVVLPLYL
jgi:hypothetical protein